jgi:hypothetical protein
MYLKIVLLYIFYNYFLKIFFSVFNKMIYVNHFDNVNQKLFFEWKGAGLFTNIASSIAMNIIYDLFWLLPYTIMNVYIFARLIIRLLDGGEEGIYAHLSFTILKVYLFWVVIYLCLTGFGFFEADTINKLSSPIAPYGSFTITYLLLGNFVFLILFIPAWNKFLKKWVL